MKRLILLTIICFSGLYSKAQVKTTKYKAVPLVESRTYELDGGMIVFNTSRVIIPIQLPPNTIEWYYAFTSYSNEDVVNSKSAGIELASQLTRIIDQSGTTANALSFLLAPTGSAASNVYLFPDYENAKNFVNKTDQDFFATYWKVYNDYSVPSANQGKQIVKLNTESKYYLGIQAGSSPVIVNIEIVAIVDESVIDYGQWSEETKSTVINLLKESLMTEEVPEEQAVEISICVTDAIAADYPANIFFELSAEGINSVLETYLTKCYEQIEGFGQTEEQRKAVTYGNLGWQYYENDELDKAIEYSLKALETQKDLGYVKANLGLFYFIKGDDLKANEYYVEALVDFKKNKLTGKESLKAAIDDIDAAKKRHFQMKGYEAVLKELKREYESWI